jgi:hypothetical protein
MLGHSRRDIRNSVAVALAQIGDSSSIPFLIGGLYGSSNRPSQFRPSVDVAAQSLASFPVEQRLEVLDSLKYPIRPSQIQTILDGIHIKEAYRAAERLRTKGFILTDWAESDLQVFAAIDEERVWPEVKALVGKQENFRLQHIYQHLSHAKKVDLMFDMVEHGVDDAYYYGWLVDTLLVLDCDSEAKAVLIGTLKDKITAHTGKFEKRERLLGKLNSN